jgi:hypothetical protein
MLRDELAISDRVMLSLYVSSTRQVDILQHTGNSSNPLRRFVLHLPLVRSACADGLQFHIATSLGE